MNDLCFYSLPDWFIFVKRLPNDERIYKTTRQFL